MPAAIAEVFADGELAGFAVYVLALLEGYADPVKFADGNPYGTSHIDGQGTIPVDDIARDAAAFQGRRVATITAALKAGLVAA